MTLDPSSWPGGGGGAAVTARENLGGTPVTINNGAIAFLPWTGTSGPDTLLDRTSTTQPKIITSGVYAVAVTVDPQDVLTAGGGYLITLRLDRFGDDAEVTSSATGSTAQPSPSCAVSGVWYLDANDVIDVRARNFDGAAALDYALTEAIVQRIS